MNPINIEMTAEECRMLAAAIGAIEPYLNQEQRQLAAEVCAKCIVAGGEMTTALLIEHGPERAEELADRAIREHPDADAPIRLARPVRWRWPKFRPAIFDWARDLKAGWR